MGLYRDYPLPVDNGLINMANYLAFCVLDTSFGATTVCTAKCHFMTERERFMITLETLNANYVNVP